MTHGQGEPILDFDDFLSAEGIREHDSRVPFLRRAWNQALESAQALCLHLEEESIPKPISSSVSTSSSGTSPPH